MRRGSENRLSFVIVADDVLTSAQRDGNRSRISTDGVLRRQDQPGRGPSGREVAAQARDVVIPVDRLRYRVLPRSQWAAGVSLACEQCEVAEIARIGKAESSLSRPVRLGDGQ